MPSQKSGMLIPAMTNPSVARPPARAAARRHHAEGDADERRQPIARNVSSSVTGSDVGEQRRERGAGHVVLAEVAAEQAGRASCRTGRAAAGRGRDPSRIAATFSGVARNPSIVRTGSPGTRRMSRNTNTLSVSSTGIVISTRRPTNAQRGAHCALPVAVDGGVDLAEHRLGEAEVLGGEAGGSSASPSIDRLDERRVLLEGAPAQRRRVRLGLETERDLEAQLGGELEQVAVVRRRGDRPVQRFVGGSRCLAGIAGGAVGVERLPDRVDVTRCAALRRGRGDEPLDQRAEVEQHLELGPSREQRVAHRVLGPPASRTAARRRRRCDRGGSSTKPWLSSRCSASRIVVRPVPSICASSRSGGRRCPWTNSPRTIAVTTRSAICCAALRRSSGAIRPPTSASVGTSRSSPRRPVVVDDEAGERLRPVDDRLQLDVLVDAVDVDVRAARSTAAGTANWFR